MTPKSRLLHFSLVFSTASERHLLLSSGSSSSSILERLCDQLSSLLPHSNWGFLSAKPRWKQSAMQESLDANLGPLQDLEGSLHALLDLLPDHLAFHLDLIWIAPAAMTTQDTPVELYGALKRARDWHGAKIVLVTSASDHSRPVRNDFLDDLRAETLLVNELEHLGEFLPNNLLWRGSLSFTDDDGFLLRSLPEFELVAKDEHALETELPGATRRPSKIRCKRLARHMKVMAACSLSKVPKDCLTDRVFLLRTSKKDCTSEEFLEDESLFGQGKGLVVKLQFCEVDSGLMESAMPRRITQEWKKAVTNSTLGRCLDDNMEKPLEALFFLVFSSLERSDLVCRECHEKVAILLNGLPSEGLSSATDSDAHCTNSRFLVNEDDLAVISDKILGTSQLKDIAGEELLDEFEWDEKRLLAFLDHQAKLNRNKTAISETMTPSGGDFVVLEAKELLKHFTSDGLPKNDNLEVLKPKSAPILSDIDDVYDLPSWPNDFFLDYHGVHYNRCEQSEENDREAMRLQRLHVGSRETAATCCTSQNASKQIVVTKTLRSEAATRTNVREKKSPRRSPRKKASSSVITDCSKPSCSRVAPLQRLNSAAVSTTSSTTNDKDEIFRKKLRNAVYEALEEKGIDERHKLFKNCFRKLFEICKLYGKDMPPNTASTKLWLGTVAKQNAETVVNLEIALNGN